MPPRIGLSFLAVLLGCSALPAQQTFPHLERRGQATQLIVDGKPFLMLGGELHNSSSSSLEYMKPEWKLLADAGLNTVVMPLSWELVEPTEGHFDFALVDGLLEQARAENVRIVFLWLAAWKNGMSGYPPVWVKRDVHRFPRVVEGGAPQPILSTLSPALREADAKAFKALMEHIRAVDSAKHTVLMMQVENEVGILGNARDHSDEADKAFAGPVPAQLMRYLETHRATLNDELRTFWEKNGAKTQGSWVEVFGDSLRTSEIFMAWHYAGYVNAVAAAGKSAYPIPMYANAWLGGGDTPPGDYPSGGPQPRVIDVWKAAGSALDMESPDLYAAGFAGWATRYHRADNPLFIPETNSGAAGAAAVFYAVGEQNALGFSPFGIDAGMHAESGPYAENAAKGLAELGVSYKVLAELGPEIAEAEAAGTIHGFMLDKEHPAVDFAMHGMTVHVSLDELFGHRAESGFGLVIEEGAGRYLGAGKGFRVTFSPQDAKAPMVGLASVDEGQFEHGSWVAGRRLNGDEDDQGNAWRFDQRTVHIERAVLYESLR